MIQRENVQSNLRNREKVQREAFRKIGNRYRKREDDNYFGWGEKKKAELSGYKPIRYFYLTEKACPLVSDSCARKTSDGKGLTVINMKNIFGSLKNKLGAGAKIVSVKKL